MNFPGKWKFTWNDWQLCLSEINSVRTLAKHQGEILHILLRWSGDMVSGEELERGERRGVEREAPSD